MAAAPLPKPPPPPPLLGSTEVPFIPTASPQPPLGRTAALDEKHAADPAPSSATWGPPGAGAAAVHDVVVVVVVLLLQLSVPVAPGARVGCRDCRNACSTGRPAPVTAETAKMGMMWGGCSCAGSGLWQSSLSL